MQDTAKTKYGLIVAGAFALSACGGNTSVPTVNVAPVTQRLGTGTVVLDYDAATKIFAVTVNGVVQSDIIFFDTSANHGTMLGMVNSSGTKYAAVSQTDNSLVYIAATNSAAAPFGFTVFARLTETALPTAGSATFTGDYAGIFRQSFVTPVNDVTSRVRGDVSLDANFDTATISGSITNRQLYDLNGVLNVGSPVSDISMTVGSINATGGFSGNMTGGGITNGLWLPAYGNYQGLISGPTAGEIVGGVFVSHSTNGAIAYQETGGFLATK